MKTIFLASFLRDIKKLRHAKLQHAIAGAIGEVERATSLAQVGS